MHLCIDMPEMILTINFSQEEKKNSRIFFKLSSIGKILSTISFQFNHKFTACLFLYEDLNS